MIIIAAIDPSLNMCQAVCKVIAYNSHSSSMKKVSPRLRVRARSYFIKHPHSTQRNTVNTVDAHYMYF